MRETKKAEKAPISSLGKWLGCVGGNRNRNSFGENMSTVWNLSEQS